MSAKTTTRHDFTQWGWNADEMEETNPFRELAVRMRVAEFIARAARSRPWDLQRNEAHARTKNLGAARRAARKARGDE